jgi:hypothetical protein
MDFPEWSEWIDNLLATLVMLRVFGTYFHCGGRYDPTEVYLPFIMQVSNRAPLLEYFAILMIAKITTGGYSVRRGFFATKRNSRHRTYLLKE